MITTKIYDTIINIWYVSRNFHSKRQRDLLVLTLFLISIVYFLSKVDDSGVLVCNHGRYTTLRVSIIIVILSLLPVRRRSKIVNESSQFVHDVATNQQRLQRRNIDTFIRILSSKIWWRARAEMDLMPKSMYAMLLSTLGLVSARCQTDNWLQIYSTRGIGKFNLSTWQIGGE